MTLYRVIVDFCPPYTQIPFSEGRDGHRWASLTEEQIIANIEYILLCTIAPEAGAFCNDYTSCIACKEENIKYFLNFHKKYSQRKIVL